MIVNIELRFRKFEDQILFRSREEIVIFFPKKLNEIKILENLKDLYREIFDRDKFIIIFERIKILKIKVEDPVYTKKIFDREKVVTKIEHSRVNERIIPTIDIHSPLSQDV